MDKEFLIAKAHSLKTSSDLLALLNEIKVSLIGDNSRPFTMKQLLILCNPKNNKKHYNCFEIPKKSGGVREIYAPSGNLKWFQRCLNELFKAIYSPSPYAMGFTVGKSIVDNAKVHTNQNYVFNIDLKDFFPSIDQARVWKRLQLSPFNFNEKITSVIAGLCSIKSFRKINADTFRDCYVLPQGAPTSPLLTNAICDTLDRRLHGLAKRFGLHYTRYADDITFSSMHNVYKYDGEFRKELERIITDQRFTINTAKTRLCHCSSCQEVTGLTVGQKINVARKYIKDLRAILHIWDKYGKKAAYAAFYPRYKSEKCQVNRGEPNLENVLSGKLCYLKMIKGDDDPIYMKLHSQYIRLSQMKEKFHQKTNIEYLFTMPKVLFESKLKVKIEFRERITDKRKYGCFEFQDRFFVIALSKNLNPNNLPADTQISLTRMLIPEKIDKNRKKIKPIERPQKTRMGYLLHKPLHGYRPNYNSTVSDDLKNFVISLAQSYPELHFDDDLGILEQYKNENLLEILVNSDFDLSILP